MPNQTHVDGASVQSIVTRPFAAWLDKNCDAKRRHVGEKPLPELGGKVYECDIWEFVIEDNDDGETPSIVITVEHQERSEYMGVVIENRDEVGKLEAAYCLGLFTSVDDLETVLKVLTRVNR